MEQHNKLNITQWALEDRPREKMMLKGIQALSNAELLAILIGSGNRRETAVELSQRILNDANNSLSLLGKRTIDELINGFEGIGEAKAITIIAALELGRRRKGEEGVTSPQITASNDVYHYMYAQLADLPHEEFWVVLVSQSNRILDRVKIGQGGVDAVQVDMRMVFRTAVMRGAPAIVVCHNHPSGKAHPSNSDDTLTQKIVAASKHLDIRLLDHIIVTSDTYYSYNDRGRL